MLLDYLGNPHRGRKTIHIAGTKGKGSTAAMLSGILSAAGLKTGLFISPHLVSWQERISVDGHMISKADFSHLANLIKPQALAINEESRYGKLTTFEVLTAMAFCYFREKEARFQVLETGMGGRLDSTNVVDDPTVCIISSISLDHTQVLGGTLDLIAREKAGIIKPGCTVITAPQVPEVMAVIQNRCDELRAGLTVCGRDITWHAGTSGLAGQSFTVYGKLAEYELSIPLLGDFQMENTSLVIGAIETLQKKGFDIEYTQIVRGLRRVKWPARMQVLNTRPLLVIDGAHNPYSVERMVTSIRKCFKYKRVLVIFGSSRDKDIEGMARSLSTSFADEVILVRSSHPRAAGTDYLASIFSNANMKYEAVENASEALGAALHKAEADDLILATGSLFAAADIEKEFKKMQKSNVKRPHPHGPPDPT